MFVLRRLFWKFLFSLFALGSVSLWASPSFLGQFSMFGRYGTVQGGAGGEVEGSFGNLLSFGYMGGYGNIGWNQEGFNHRLGALFARSEKWGGGMLWRTYGEWDGAQLSSRARGQFILGGSLRWRTLEGWINVSPFVYGKERATQKLSDGQLKDGALLLPTSRWKTVWNYTDFGGRVYFWRDRFYVGARGKIQKNPKGGVGLGGDGLFGVQIPLWGSMDGRLEAVTGYDTANGFVLKARVGIRYLLGKKMPSITALPMVERPYEAVKESNEPLLDQSLRTKTEVATNLDELLKFLHDPTVAYVQIRGNIDLPKGGIMVPYGLNLGGTKGSVTLSDGREVHFIVADASSDHSLTGKTGTLVSLGGNNTLEELTLNANGNVAVTNFYNTGYYNSAHIVLNGVTVKDGVVDLRAGRSLRALAVELKNNRFILSGDVDLSPKVLTHGDHPIAALVQLVAEDGGVVKLVGAGGQTVEGKLKKQNQVGLLAVAGNLQLEHDVTMFDNVTATEEGGSFLFVVASVGAKDSDRKHTLTVVKKAHVRGFETLFWADGYTSASLGNSAKGEFGFNASLGTIEVDDLGGNKVFARNFLTATPDSRVDGTVRVENLQVKTWTPDTENAFLNLSGLVIDGGVYARVTPSTAIAPVEGTFFDLHGAKIEGTIKLAGSFVPGTTLRDHSLVNLQGVLFNKGSVDLGDLDFSNVFLTIGTAGAPALFDMTNMAGPGTVTFGNLKLGTLTFNEPATIFNLSGTKGMTVALPDGLIGGRPKFNVNIGAQAVTILNLTGAAGLTLTGNVGISGTDKVSLVPIKDYDGLLNAGGLHLYVTALDTGVSGSLLNVSRAVFSGNSSLPTFHMALNTDTTFVLGFSFVRLDDVTITGPLKADFANIGLTHVRFSNLAYDKAIALFEFHRTVLKAKANVNVYLPSGNLVPSAGSTQIRVVDAPSLSVGAGGKMYFTTNGVLGTSGLGGAGPSGQSFFYFPNLDLADGARVDFFGAEIKLDGGDYGAGKGIIFNAENMKIGSGAKLYLPKLVGVENVHVATGEGASLYNVQNITVTNVADSAKILPLICFGSPYEDDKAGVYWTTGGMDVVEGSSPGLSYVFLDMESSVEDENHAVSLEVNGRVKPGSISFGGSTAGVTVLRAPALTSSGEVNLALDWTETFKKNPPVSGRSYDGVRFGYAAPHSVIRLYLKANSKAGSTSGSVVDFYPISPEDARGSLEVYDHSTNATAVHRLLAFPSGATLTEGTLLYLPPSKGMGALMSLDGHEGSNYVVEIATDHISGSMDAQAVRIELHKEFAGTLKFTGSHWNYGDTSANVATDFISATGISSDLVGKIEVDPSLNITFQSGSATNFAQWLKDQYPGIENKINP